MSKLKGYVDLKLRSNSNIWSVCLSAWRESSRHTQISAAEQSGMGWMTNALI